ncbi:MAG: hypothetical protein JWO38_1077 [Gemmataceae bacterium]|nr:hypothetical protein [Gemmataceae bacterium]
MRNLLVGLVGLVTAGAVFNPRPAQAWHEIGHMSVALIAYRQLDDGQQKKVQEILKEHPHFDLFLSADAPADARPDEWVVMRAAIWPDWVRSPRSAGQGMTKIKEEFNRPSWHFVNKPIRHLVGADPTTRATIEENIGNPKKDRGEVLKKLPDLLAGLNGPNNGDLPSLVSTSLKPTINASESRAIALCWVLHLVGDLHQPLHAAALFSKDSVDGDRGGNGFIIRWQNRAADLHSIWDGGFGWDELKGSDGSQYAAVDLLVRDLSKRIKPTQQDLGVTSPDAWSEESLKLAQTMAYFVNGKLLPGVFVGPLEHRPHAADLDKLPDGYGTRVQEVAEQRVTLAGCRLKNVLADLSK